MQMYRSRKKNDMKKPPRATENKDEKVKKNVGNVDNLPKPE